MKYLLLFENFKNNIDLNEETFTMYHGTDKLHEKLLMKDGFIPNSCSSGSQCGNPAYLYLTMSPESAGWYACMKDNEESIIEVTNVPKSYLCVDPEDGMFVYPKLDLDKELEYGGSFILKKELPAHHFKIYEGKLSITGCDDGY